MINWIRKWGLSIFFFLLPWQTRWIFGAVDLNAGATQYGMLSLYATECLLLLVVLLRGRPMFTRQTFLPRVLFGLTAFVFVISAIFSTNLVLSFHQLMHVAFAGLLFLTLLDKRVDLSHVVVAFGLGLVLPVILGAFQFLFGGSPDSTLLGLASRDALRAGDAVLQSADGLRRLRAYGSFSHPNIFGGYLAVGVVAAGWLFYSDPFSLRIKNKQWFYGSLLFILFIGLALTVSRSAWLGLVLAFIVAFIVTTFKRVQVSRILVMPVAAIFIAGVFALTYGLHVNFRPGSDGSFEFDSIDERVQQYQDFPELITGHEIFGWGMGSYVFALEHVYPERDWFAYQPIHNVALLIVGEIGLVGLMVVILWLGSIDYVNFSRFPNKDAVAAFMMGNVLLFIVFFDHYLWSQWSGLALTAFVMALTARMGEGVDG